MRQQFIWQVVGRHANSCFAFPPSPPSHFRERIWSRDFNSQYISVSFCLLTGGLRNVSVYLIMKSAHWMGPCSISSCLDFHTLRRTNNMYLGMQVAFFFLQCFHETKNGILISLFKISDTLDSYRKDGTWTTRFTFNFTKWIKRTHNGEVCIFISMFHLWNYWTNFD